MSRLTRRFVWGTIPLHMEGDISKEGKFYVITVGGKVHKVIATLVKAIEFESGARTLNKRMNESDRLVRILTNDSVTSDLGIDYE